jgi:hypothetical protein
VVSVLAFRIADTETMERCCRDLRGVVHPFAEERRRMLERIVDFMMVLYCVLECSNDDSALHNE